MDVFFLVDHYTVDLFSISGLFFRGRFFRGPYFLNSRVQPVHVMNTAFVISNALFSIPDLDR